MKTTAARLAHEYSTDWNDAGTCFIRSYIPQYSALGIPGMIFKLFASEAFSGSTQRRHAAEIVRMVALAERVHHR